MTEHKGYTPGPWELHRHKWRTWEVRIPGETGACYVNADRDEDNRLIADAPRLYEENERLRELLVRCLDARVRQDQGVPSPIDGDLAYDIRAALAAKG
jgi:hypothetical protein